MEWVFIVNPAAGTGRALQAALEIQSFMNQQHAAFRMEETTRQGEATEIARRAAARLGADGTVVAVGGDGTVREVAAGLCGTETAMGIIPAGTGNDLIKSTGIPSGTDEALRFLLRQEAVPIDTGTVNDQFFLNVSGIGFDVTVLDETEKYKARFHGLLPYFLGLLRAIRFYSPQNLCIETDQERFEGAFLICSVANGRFIGGGIPICPSADVTDHRFDCVLIRHVPRWKIPFYLPGLMMGRDLSFRVTKHLKTTSISVLGAHLRVNVDGEILAMEHADYRIHPGSLRLVCCPRG